MQKAVNGSFKTGYFFCCSYGFLPIYETDFDDATTFSGMDSAKRVALVIGGAGRIGFCICGQLLESNFQVVFFDIREKEGKQVESSLQTEHGLENVIFMKGDVTSQTELKGAFEKAKTEFGRLDLVINNAAVVAELDSVHTVNVNLLGSIYGCELALQYMGTRNGGKGGIVINVSSIAGLLPYPDTPTYVATKHGLIGLTRSYGNSLHFLKNEVTFMAICPYYTKTLIERETLKMCNPKIDESMLIPVEKVTEGIMKMLDEKRNGSVLLVLLESMEYVDIPDYLRKIPTAMI